jgi:hypothetical protein
MNLRRVFWVILAFCANFKANAQKSVNFQTYYKKLTFILLTMFLCLILTEYTKGLNTRPPYAHVLNI